MPDEPTSLLLGLGTCDMPFCGREVVDGRCPFHDVCAVCRSPLTDTRECSDVMCLSQLESARGSWRGWGK